MSRITALRTWGAPNSSVKSQRTTYKQTPTIRALRGRPRSGIDVGQKGLHSRIFIVGGTHAPVQPDKEPIADVVEWVSGT